MKTLQELQEIIRTGNKVAGRDFSLERVIPDEISDELYGTLVLGTSEDFNGGVLSADELLVEAIEETIRRGEDVFQLVGLALKNGATPNLYVTVNFHTDEGLTDITVLHIIVYAWRIFLERGENYRLLLHIVAMLCAAGADVKLPVTDPEILVQRRRKLKRSVSTAQVMEDVGIPKSVLAYIVEAQNGYDEDDEEAFNLSEMLLKYIAVFTAFRNTLGDVKDIIHDDFFVAGDIQVSVEISETDAEDVGRLAIMIGELLDEPSHMSGTEGDEKLKECIGLHANRCAKQLLESDSITIEGAEEAFLEAVDSYNGVGVALIVEHGFRPRYNHLDRIIFLGELKEHQGLHLSSEIQTGILFKLVKLGLSLDHEQLSELGSYSESTFFAISEQQSIPYWKRTCSAPGKYVRDDLKALARELDLNPELEKDALCSEFNAIASATVGSLSEASKKLRTRKLQVAGTTLGDVVKGETSKPVECENEGMLSRPLDDYSNLDLHCVSEGDGKKSYCFEAIDYPKILRSGVNFYTNVPLSVSDLAEIRAKRDTLIMLGLPLESTGIEAAIAKLHSTGGSEDYELWVRARRDHFLDVVNSSEIGLSRLTFTDDEVDGGLSIDEMQDIINKIGRRNDLHLSPTNNREHAVRSFALTFMEYIDDIEDQAESPEEATAGVRMLFDELVQYVQEYEQPEPEEE